MREIASGGAATSGAGGVFPGSRPDLGGSLRPWLAGGALEPVSQYNNSTRPGKRANITNWKDPPFFMGQLTISMAIFNSKLLVYQRVCQEYHNIS